MVRDDIINFFNYFHASGGFGKSLNATFIALITKKIGAVNMKDFRPLSLIGSGYKTLAKVFTNRWKTILRELSTQNVFIHGRQLHCVLIECLKCRLRERNLRVLCKLDSEKTYDLVKLGFSPINTKQIWFWGTMVEVDVFLYF